MLLISRLVVCVAAVLNLPMSPSYFRNEMKEKRRIAAEEKRREVVLKLAKSEEVKAERMSLVLNQSPYVQKKRKTFALLVLLQQAVYFVMVMGVFIAMTPPAPDFRTDTMARYRTVANERFKETYVVSGGASSCLPLLCHRLRCLVLIAPRR